MAQPATRVAVHDAALQQTLVQHALVQWHDASAGSQHLGRVSDQDDGRASLTLWIGHCVGKLLLYLHLPIRIRPSQLKTAKDIYIIVPVERLVLGIDAVPVRDLGPDTQSQLRRDGMQEPDLVACARFALGEPAYAVMPVGSRGPERPLSGAPRQIILLLRSLVEARVFRVFTKHGSAFSQLEDVRVKLERGCVQTPELDLASMYNRGCYAGKNVWHHYPCAEAEVDSLVWNPLVDANPPPYEEAISAAAEAASKSFSDALIWRVTPQPRPDGPMFKDAYPCPDDALRGQKRKAGEAVSEHEFQSGTTTEPYSSPSQTDQALFVDAARLEAAVLASLRSRDERLDWRLLTTPQLLPELREWLIRAWNHDPRAHETYREQLLLLGACARNADIARFDGVLAECQTALLRRAARRSTASPASPLPPDLEDDVDEMRTWLNVEVCRNAGTLMMDLLVELQGAAVVAKAAAVVAKAAGPDDGGATGMFLAKKALCLASAFYVFGERV
ncbi:hypothetical protein SLS57_005268 [Botryosphaeria dothidea]